MLPGEKWEETSPSLQARNMPAYTAALKCLTVIAERWKPGITLHQGEYIGLCSLTIIVLSLLLLLSLKHS
jgi:hypothetical protein